MGYYTNFTIDVTKGTKNVEQISYDENLAVARRLSEVSDWFEESDVHTDFDYPLEEMIEHDEMKWYDHFEDMRQISMEFPDLYFVLTGYGEDAGDFWREYFHNGDGFGSLGRIVYDSPNWMEWENN